MNVRSWRRDSNARLTARKGWGWSGHPTGPSVQWQEHEMNTGGLEEAGDTHGYAELNCSTGADAAERQTS